MADGTVEEYWALVKLVAEAQYEDARQRCGECQEWPSWGERDGLIGADYMNAARAAVKALRAAGALGCVTFGSDVMSQEGGAVHWCGFLRHDHNPGYCGCGCFNCSYFERYKDDLHRSQLGRGGDYG